MTVLHIFLNEFVHWNDNIKYDYLNAYVRLGLFKKVFSGTDITVLHIFLNDGK